MIFLKMVDHGGIDEIEVQIVVYRHPDSCPHRPRLLMIFLKMVDHGGIDEIEVQIVVYRHPDSCPDRPRHDRSRVYSP